MEIKYITDGTMTEKQQRDVDIISKTCLSGDPNEPEEEFDESTCPGTWYVPAF